ncbi:unnamed protein product [Rotaria magnacalcarata]|uniref:Non-structural maintenance of chromosomes element 4 n=2 Tax=Rotaria magnacalcarata TaxID=392030 RepID=A0A818WMM1_9BILA|nr:unnamed protein product [Rotaria magnacalcarata]
MEDPPARNAAWRYGFDVPANYDDVGLNCGGLGVQSLNGGKCGICGDSYDGSRYHESGGKYATNIIVRHYLSGALIDVKILLSANHKGFMEFRLCPTVDSNREVTQECLDQNVLDIQGFGKQYSVSEGLDLIFLRVHLPPGLSCSRCVLQWRYHAGNNWGRNTQTGEACLGCGLQEEFYNCADISIAAVDNNFLLMHSTTMPSNHLFLLPFLNPVFLSRIHTPSPFIVYPTMMTSTDTTPTTTITDARQSFIFPFSPSRELIDQIDANNKTLRCYPTNEALKPLIVHRPELIQPEDEDLFNQLDECNEIYKDVRTPREGVLDLIALKTISSFTRIQTIAIDKRSTVADAFKLIRKCAKIIKNNFKEYDDAFAEFYTEFSQCHKTTGMMNFMSGRLPTFWFEKRTLEKSFMKQRAHHTRESVDLSQRTQIQEIKQMIPSGEQTSQEIIRMNRCLEEAYQNNDNQPVSFFMFTIHPKLFCRSVENIFHVSFLIKEGKAELFLDENQLPVLRPSNKSDTQNDSTINNGQKSSSHQVISLTQLILSLDIEQWETLVDVFDIQTSMINDKS